MKVKLTRGEIFPVYTLSTKNKRWWVYTLRKAITPSPDTEKTLDMPWWVWKSYQLVERAFGYIQSELGDLYELYDIYELGDNEPDKVKSGR